MSTMPPFRPMPGFGPSIHSPRSATASFPPQRPAPRMDIRTLREALQTVELQMATLMSQREAIELNLVEAVRLENPIWRLHRELLSAIFLIGVSGESEIMVSTLMLVCRHWKDVALDTALLWTNISIDHHHRLDSARRKLTLSKAAPLYIEINFSPREERNGGMEDVVQSMDLIRPALCRTKSLRISVPNRPHAHACAMRLREEAPLLELFSFRVYHSMAEEYTAYPMALFTGLTPRLQSCSFTSYNFAWDTSILQGLRCIKLGGYWNGLAPSMEVLFSVLRNAPQLEELVLRNISDIDPDMWDEHVLPTIHLPRLKKASFSHTGLMRTHLLLSKISFPALAELEFAYFNDLTPILKRLQVQALTSLPLRHLHLESCLFNESIFVSLLARLRSITTLELVDIEDASSHLLRALSTPPTSQPWYCPKLETLSIDGCTSLDWDSLRNFIESRLPPNPKAYHPKRESSSLGVTSSASAAAEAYARSRPVSINSALALIGPKCLRSIDVTRCHQISREMVQWLRVYISDVRAEPGRGVWGETG